MIGLRIGLLNIMGHMKMAGYVDTASATALLPVCNALLKAGVPHDREDLVKVIKGRQNY